MRLHSTNQQPRATVVKSQLPHLSLDIYTIVPAVGNTKQGLLPRCNLRVSAPLTHAFLARFVLVDRPIMRRTVRAIEGS